MALTILYQTRGTKRSTEAGTKLSVRNGQERYVRVNQIRQAQYPAIGISTSEARGGIALASSLPYSRSRTLPGLLVKPINFCSEFMASATKTPPSARWQSYEGWDYNGMKERLEEVMASINKSAFLKHVENITQKEAKMSELFSAGQYWCCFEFIMEDQSLVIARVRLPRHPDSDGLVTAESESYAIQCEVSTMSYLQNSSFRVPLPKLYAYGPPGFTEAREVGACYMLIEGFYGNTLQEVQPDICGLPMEAQEHIIGQWTSNQAELAICTFPTIGSIPQFSGEIYAETTIGRLGAAAAERFRTLGPSNTSHEYFTALGEARYITALKEASEAEETDKFVALGTYIFRDIVARTELFKDSSLSFPLNHIDMGTQNILVDDEYNFPAIIDWEFARTAPVQVNHYPMLFTQLFSDARVKEILKDPNYIAHRNIARQCATRELCRRKFHQAEEELRDQGRIVHSSIADELDRPASRIFSMLESLDRFDAEELTYEMVRIAFGFEGDDARHYVKEMEVKMRSE